MSMYTTSIKKRRECNNYTEITENMKPPDGNEFDFQVEFIVLNALASCTFMKL